MSRPPFQPIIEALPNLVPFVGPEAMARRRGRPFRARLGANESAFGASPKAVTAMQAAAVENWKYSDPENYELLAALADHHNVELGNVVVGEGIDGLLGLTCHLFLRPGDHVVTTDGAYPTFNVHVGMYGGVVVKVPMRDLREDLSALAAEAHRKSARLVYVSNPNNPVGSFWSAGTLTHFIAELPAETILVLDEAYAETAPTGSLLPLDVSNPRVLRYRTFSKAYGLAGARIGYALGSSDVIAGFEKVRNHYGINRVGQIGALAALMDQTYLSEAVSKIEMTRRRIAEIANDNGLMPLPSAANFVAIDCGGDGAFADLVLEQLLAQDCFARKPMTPVGGLNRLIRISCGSGPDVDYFASVLGPALSAARG